MQKGDTLYSIALAFQRDYREIARWNNLEDPTKLRIGQLLRVAPLPPEGEAVPGAATSSPPVAAAEGVEVRPLGSPSGAGSGARAALPSSAPTTMTPPPAATFAEPTGFVWPLSGKVAVGFDEPRSKGIEIDGREGDPVIAAQDGLVVYAGNSLRGYPNLVIIKHSDDVISAYANNRQILVSQGQTVRRSQKIAELGRSETDVPRLHFEIRRQGKPVDPTKYLPPR